MRAILTAAVLFLVSGTATAQVICTTGPAGITTCSGSFAQPMPQQGFAFGNGVSTGAGVLESFKRQDLLVEQTRRLELENELLRRQLDQKPPKCRMTHTGQYLCTP